MDEKLRFVIDLQNRASAELRKLQREMGGVKQTPGMLQAKTWFAQLESASASTTKAIRPLAGGLNTIGVSGLAAGLSVAGLISQFRDLAKAMPALQELSRQTGISKTELERLKQTAANLNIDPSKMTAAISYFSGEMVQFSKQSGEVYAEMQNGASGLARKIASEWKEHPEEALKDYLGWLAQIPEASKRAGKSAQEGVQIQRYWAQKGLGDADMAQIVGKGMGNFQEAYRQAAQDVGQITDEMVRQSEAFDRSITRFDTSWNNLKRDLGATVLPGLSAATDNLRQLFDEVKAEPALLAVGAGAIGAMAIRRRIMRSGGGVGGAGLSAAAGKLTTAATEQVAGGKGLVGAAEALTGAAAKLEGAALSLGGKPGAGKATSGAAPAAPVPVEPENPQAPPEKQGFLGGGGWKGLLGFAGEAGVQAWLYSEGKDAIRGAEDRWLGFTQADHDKSDNLNPGADLARILRERFTAAGASSGGGARQLYTMPAIEEDRASRVRDVGGPSRESTSPIAPVVVPVPVPTAFRVPAAYDREMRARAAGDGRDHSLDGVVVGALGREVIHLTGTLKSAAGTIADGIHPAAFHPIGGAGFGTALDAQGMIEAGVKAGTLAALREWAGMQDLEGRGKGDAGGGGFTPAAFHPGGGMDGGRSASAAGRSPNMRYGRQHMAGGSNGLGRFDGGAPGANGYGLTNAPYTAPLDAKGEGGQLSPKELFSYLKAHGGTDNEATMLTGAAGSESSFNPRAVHDGGHGYGLWGHNIHDRMDLRGLSWQQQADKALAEVKREYAGRVNAAKTPEELADAEMHYERPRGYHSNNPRGGDNYTGRLNTLRRFSHGFGTMGFDPAKPETAPVAAHGSPKGAFPAWMDDKSRREIAGINAPLARDLIAASEATGTHFRILQGMRSAAEAAHNAATGRGVRNSQHLWGAAADIKLTDVQGRDLDRNDPAYERYAQAYEAHSRAAGGKGRWLGHVPGWSWDRAHFDQGIGYGQTHPREPYGVGGPTQADVKAGSFEIFRGPDNPFLKAAKPLGEAADRLRDAVKPMPAVTPEPSRIDATGGQRVQMDPLEVNIRHHRDGRTSVAARHGEGVKLSIRTAPTLVQTA